MDLLYNNVSHEFCPFIENVTTPFLKKSVDYGDVSEILSGIKLRTKLCNNGRTKNDRYQKASSKGDRNIYKIHTNTTGDKKNCCLCVRGYNKRVKSDLHISRDLIEAVKKDSTEHVFI